ncbi:hypothetical protein [Fictibacillus phosphorivorans]|uniref:hypothetical protein n=1 Tax=Fictibacillus phosphorivorans TaxID=1221500 RepID=UPI0012931386|nr:hypothetical protein [Fictibacillus phosphorivorans]MQR93688.1 hypothetical protein [Fictibacillus phosphorivorans]
MSKLKIYESSNELCEVILNYIVGNRKVISITEFDSYTKRIMMIHRKMGLALGKSKMDECFNELIIISEEMNVLLLEIKSKYFIMGRLENDIDECFTKFTKILKDCQ